MKRRPGRPSGSTELKQRILDTAADVFSRSGYDGARIEHIAKAAGCTRALVYFHFRSKAALFEAVLDDSVTRRSTQMVDQPSTLADGLVYWFGMNMAEPRRIRLVMQESLALRPTTPPPGRMRYLQGQLDVVRLFQQRGLLRTDINPRHLLMTILALTSFPPCFPAIGKAVLGTGDRDAFIAEWSSCLRRIAELLAPPAA